MTGRLEFIRLPVLEDTRAAMLPGMNKGFAGVGFVCVQHLLETTGSLIESLLHLGADASKVFVLGKAYSTNRDVAKRLRGLGVQVFEGSAPVAPGRFEDAVRKDLSMLWNKARALAQDEVNTIVILDDGGRCLQTTPEWCLKQKRTIGVEQTQSGMARLPHGRLPIILVATSAVKKFIEAPMVARAILERIRGQIEPKDKLGIVGIGHIGRSVAAALEREGNEIALYDLILQRESFGRPLKATRSGGLRKLVMESDVLFGCTGVDIFGSSAVDESWFSRCRSLASCSSEDTEFRSLLRLCAAEDGQSPLAVNEDVVCMVGNEEVRVMRGGFPVNFDGSPESVPAEDIQFTRGLLLAAVWQAVAMAREVNSCVNRPVQLASELQQFITDRWFMYSTNRKSDYDPKILQGVRRKTWIENNSEGVQTALGRLSKMEW